jgi:hypothetical protein
MIEFLIKFLLVVRSRFKSRSRLEAENMDAEDRPHRSDTNPRWAPSPIRPDLGFEEAQRHFTAPFCRPRALARQTIALASFESPE